MDLFGDATRLRDLVTAPIAQSFDHPYVRSLIVVRRSATQGTTYLPITPYPHIKQVSAKLVAIYSKASVQVELEDEQVSGISKAYAREQLLGGGVYYLLDAVMSDDEQSAVGGYTADRVKGTILADERNTWGLVLRRRQQC